MAVTRGRGGTGSPLASIVGLSVPVPGTTGTATRRIERDDRRDGRGVRQLLLMLVEDLLLLLLLLIMLLLLLLLLLLLVQAPLFVFLVDQVLAERRRGGHRSAGARLCGATRGPHGASCS